jgi:hypothetical protein
MPECVSSEPVPIHAWQQSRRYIPCYFSDLFLSQDTLVMLRTAIPPNTDDQGVANSRQLGGRLPVAQVSGVIHNTQEGHCTC